MSVYQHEYDFESSPGLPAPLPPGERILWQGSPDWRRFAVHALRAKWVAGYFALIAGWSLLSGAADGESAGALVAGLVATAIPAVLGLGLIALYAVIVAKTTIYTITDRRVILRIGVALTKCVNLPFARIAGAEVKRNADGSGDIALAMAKGDHVAWLHIVPHARPWRLRHPQPSLRALPDVAAAAEPLAAALKAVNPQGRRSALAVADAPLPGAEPLAA